MAESRLIQLIITSIKYLKIDIDKLNMHQLQKKLFAREKIMIKNPNTQEQEISEESKHQSKHKKSKTLCQDKRKSHYNCGICGSEDIIEQGIRFCGECGQEEEFINTELFHRFTYLCGCHWRNKNYYSVKKCLTCGSVESKTCPACKGRCWTYKFDNVKYCRGCGYRS